MSCGHCVSAVREALEETGGVEVLDVEIGTARVRYDAEEVTQQESRRSRRGSRVRDGGITPASRCRTQPERVTLL